MKNEDMLLQLLIKIKDSLIYLADKSTVFSIAYNALKQIDFDDLKSYQIRERYIIRLLQIFN
jgi:hypothetical protein